MVGKWPPLQKFAFKEALDFEAGPGEELTTVYDDVAQAPGPFGSYPLQAVLSANGQREKARSRAP